MRKKSRVGTHAFVGACRQSSRMNERWARRSEEGAVQVEYVVVIALVTLGLAAACVPLGALLLRSFDLIDTLIGLPFG